VFREGTSSELMSMWSMSVGPLPVKETYGEVVSIWSAPVEPIFVAPMFAEAGSVDTSSAGLIA
jgi:ApbE superfamily uncharacterized protein (UPF0280 family)